MKTTTYAFILVLGLGVHCLSAQATKQSLGKYISDLKERDQSDCSEYLYTLYVRGTYYICVGEYVKAYNAIAEGLFINPSLAAFHYKMASILEKIPSYANTKRGIFDSYTHINIAMELENNAAFHNTAIAIYEVNNKIEELIDFLEKNKLNDKRLQKLASLYEKKKNYSKALDKYNKIKNQNAGIFEAKINIYKEMGSYENLINEYNILITKYPYNEQYVIEYIELLLSESELEKAISFLKDYLGKYSMYHKLFFLYIKILILNNSLKQAEKEILVFIKKKNYNEKQKMEIIELYLENSNYNKDFIYQACKLLNYDDPEIKLFIDNLHEILKE